MKEITSNKPWYKRWYGILAWIFFLPVMLVIYTWAYTNWHKNVKIGITVFVTLFTFMVATAPSPEEQLALKEKVAAEQKAEDERKSADELRKAEEAAAEEKRKAEEAANPPELVAIEEAAVDGKCKYASDPNEVPISIGMAGSAHATGFINKGRDLFARNVCTEFEYDFRNKIVDGRGAEREDTILLFNATKDQFAEYNWANLEYKSVGTMFLIDGILIENGLPSQLKYDGIEYKGR